ncbi:hypothetical protein Btru_021543 [Bulinus truncatus]|nr:hypothetical protein Btru_021543 [Bulinus truncatus]
MYVKLLEETKEDELMRQTSPARFSNNNINIHVRFVSRDALIVPTKYTRYATRDTRCWITAFTVILAIFEVFAMNFKLTFCLIPAAVILLSTLTHCRRYSHEKGDNSGSDERTGVSCLASSDECSSVKNGVFPPCEPCSPIRVYVCNKGKRDFIKCPLIRIRRYPMQLFYDSDSQTCKVKNCPMSTTTTITTTAEPETTTYTTQPDTTPDTNEPDTTQSDTTQPETTQPDTTETYTTEPDTTETYSTEPDTTEPYTTESGTTETYTTEPDTTEPYTTEPDTTETYSTEPDTTEPYTTESGTTETYTTEPDTTEPYTTEPDTTETYSTEPDTTEPYTTESGTTEPYTTESGTTEPYTTEPDTTEPYTTEPGTTEPYTTEPDTTQPDTTETDTIP